MHYSFLHGRAIFVEKDTSQLRRNQSYTTQIQNPKKIKEKMRTEEVGGIGLA
jgi:hypothetical protein